MSTAHSSGLVRAELQLVFETHLAPRLSCTDLASLACTCSTLKAWTEDLQPSIWRSACRGRLPPLHPGPDQMAGREQVYRLLQECAAAKRNIAAGRATAIHHIPGQRPLFSPDGTKVVVRQRLQAILPNQSAPLTEQQECWTLRVYDVRSGAQLHYSVHAGIWVQAWASDSCEIRFVELDSRKVVFKSICIGSLAATLSSQPAALPPDLDVKYVRFSPEGKFVEIFDFPHLYIVNFASGVVCMRSLSEIGAWSKDERICFHTVRLHDSNIWHLQRVCIPAETTECILQHARPLDVRACAPNGRMLLAPHTMSASSFRQHQGLLEL
ncbi:hypothetical protein MMC29_002573 [Sticta canariensis]|nr:hypothetical protein [Sticta canariensis]